MHKNTDDYFKMSQAELETENQELMAAVEALRQRQMVLSRALDIEVHKGYARARLNEMGDAERIALLAALQGK